MKPTEHAMSEETRNHFILMTKYVEGIERDTKKTRLIGWVVIIFSIAQFLTVVYGILLLSNTIPRDVVVALTDYEFIITE